MNQAFGFLIVSDSQIKKLRNIGPLIISRNFFDVIQIKETLIVLAGLIRLNILLIMTLL